MVRKMILEYIVKNIPNIGYNINNVLHTDLKISNRLLQFLIKNKLISCNGSICDGIICDTRDTVKIGDIISVSMDYPEDNANIVPTEMSLDILYEDEWLLVLNKPSGIAIHPSILHYTDSLSNGVRFYFDKICLQKKIRPVNRLDFYTSGIVIFAKCAYVHEALSLQMNDGSFSKKYIAIVHGKLTKSEGTIDLPIGRKDGSIIERCVDFENGQKSITNYSVLEYREDIDCSVVKCSLVTGRTHQIRVHFASIGHPLVGDTLYGISNDGYGFDGQMLHCYCVDFVHPISGKTLHFEKNMHLQKFLNNM